MTLLFDTLKIAKSLQPAFTAEQAESLARALQDNAASDVATKADISDLRSEISELRASTKADISELRAEIKTEIAELRVDMVQQISLLRADTLKWIVSAMVFNVVAMTGLVIALIKVLGKA